MFDIIWYWIQCNNGNGRSKIRVQLKNKFRPQERVDGWAHWCLSCPRDFERQNKTMSLSDLTIRQPNKHDWLVLNSHIGVRPVCNETLVEYFWKWVGWPVTIGMGSIVQVFFTKITAYVASSSCSNVPAKEMKTYGVKFRYNMVISVSSLSRIFITMTP